MLSEGECRGCPNFDKDNPQKPAKCGLTDRYIKSMEDCPVPQPEDTENEGN
jgi:hypothetical protein